MESHFDEKPTTQPFESRPAQRQRIGDGGIVIMAVDQNSDTGTAAKNITHIVTVTDSQNALKHVPRPYRPTRFNGFRISTMNSFMDRAPHYPSCNLALDTGHVTLYI